MAKAKIYQIFYSAETRAQLDPGFLALDNLSNERPDWREYWPIRRFLLAHSLQPETYYGFFSSKFRAKTSLGSATVHELIELHAADADVISFSPHFEHIAPYLNIFEQAAACHGQLDLFRECAALIAPEFRIEQSVMTSLDTIFCNFFVAKPEFWGEWLRHAERLFEIAEQRATPLGHALNGIAGYVVVSPNDSTATDAGQTSVTLREIPGVHAKVFVIERLASLLLWSNRRWKVRSFNHLTSSPGPPLTADLFALDALKIAYRQTGAKSFLDTFHKLRQQAEPRLAQMTSKTPPKSTSTAPMPPPMPAHRSAPRPDPASPVETAPAAGASPEKIRIVCASRKTREQFVTETELGQSLAHLLPADVELRLFPSNARGLPAVYNVAIEESSDNPAILLFIHDDVYLSDAFWAERLRDAVNHFQVVGVAGNRRRVARQPSWGFRAVSTADGTLIPEDPRNLSGTVAHGSEVLAKRVDVFGPSRQSVKLLDGLFLAARSATLLAKALRFDERFDFHFYDLDFCRQAERSGLDIGTWPISLTHRSPGDFRGAAWHRNYECYMNKWAD